MKVGARFVAQVAGLLGFAIGLTISSRAATVHRCRGNYGGLIDPGGGGDPDNSGIIQIQLTQSGFFSGSITWQNQRYPMRGRLSEDGTFSKTFGKGAASKGGVVPNVPLGPGE
jgi:hypothetical protein